MLSRCSQPANAFEMCFVYRLLGIVILGKNAKDFYLIDINYFPGYNGMEHFADVFCR